MNTSAFRQLFDDFYVALCLFAERYLENPDEAEDTVQEAFIRLWQRRKNFNNSCAAKSFLYTTVRNSALNRLEHQKVVKKYYNSLQIKKLDAFFHDHVVEQESFRIFMGAINALPEQTRKVMLLALDGQNNRGIAAALNIAEGTVHSHKKIAYRRLREKLKDNLPILLLVLFLSAGK